MSTRQLYLSTLKKFRGAYGRDPEVVAYAPGRVEVLGNHTDYNEGCVLSAAIDRGTFFAAARAAGEECRLTAGDLMREVLFNVGKPEAMREDGWANYVLGVLDGLAAHAAPRALPGGFDALFLGDLPLGSGLSSSAALEIGTGLALARLYGSAVEPMQMARIGQRAEHLFAGVQCGLLDQITVLCGRGKMLVQTDFRSLAVRLVPLGGDCVLLLCDTGVRHALVDGEYNRRRADCEAATAYFARVLPHPVSALRDVSWSEWQEHKGGLAERVARRAAHPIGEQERVLAGSEMLASGDLEGFGQLMFASHESSRRYFENSCPELDFLVAAARQTPGLLGARLSGGGFGGSVVALARRAQAAAAGRRLAEVYAQRFGAPCTVRMARPSDGARLVMPEERW